MSETRSAQTNGAGWASAWITAILAASAAATIGYWSVMAFGEGDTEAMESPLMLSVARQLVAGPWELYGPFDGSNPLVLIHAPLYYRAAALLAWPMARRAAPGGRGADGGRLISALGLAATAMAAYRLGRLGGLPARAGWWSALLVAASPVLAGQPFAVRPDMAGVALQSWGVVLALEGLGRGGRRLGLASVLFGVSACVKQHLVAAWAVSGLLTVAAWVRGRAGSDAVARVVVPGVVVAAAVYGAEWLVTGGRVWDAAVVAAAHVGRVHPGSWDHVFIVSLGVTNRSAGLVALLSAAALTGAGLRSGMMRWPLIAIGSVAIGVVLGALMVHIWEHGATTGAVTFLSTIAAAAVALPAVALSGRGSSPGIGIDAALWAYVVAEAGLATLLCRMSTGAWLNYAIPATVFASALAARGLARAVDAGMARWAALPGVLASLAMLAASLYGIGETERTRRRERISSEEIYEHRKQPRSSYFFVDRPGFNRVNGRPSWSTTSGCIRCSSRSGWPSPARNGSCRRRCRARCAR